MIFFDRCLDTRLLEEAFLEVIKDEGLLRSVLVDKKGDLLWNEFTPPGRLSIPYVDLSECDIEMKEKIINEIINRETFKDHRSADSVLYRPILFKKDLRNYLFFLSVDHSIIDRMSLEIMERNILNYYQAKEKSQEPVRAIVKPYSAYIQQIGRGPQNLDETELIKMFDLEEYCHYKEQCEKILKEKEAGKFNLFTYDIQFAKGMSEENVWDLAYVLFNVVLKRYFGLSKIPLKIVSYGRRYQEDDYFETVGEFLDLIPILVDVDEENPFTMIDDVRKKVESASKYNINFLSLIFDKELREKWKNAVSLIVPGQTESDDYLVLFNFEGKVPEAESEQIIQVGLSESLVPKICSLLCDAGYTSNFLKFIITTPIESDIENIKKILEEESRHLIKKVSLKKNRGSKI